MLKQGRRMVVGGVLLGLTALVAVATASAVDVSVMKPHTALVERGLRALMEHSVRDQAGAVHKPASVNLSDLELRHALLGTAARPAVLVTVRPAESQIPGWSSIRQRPNS